MQTYNTIYEYITQQETNYELPIQIIDAYDWSMKEHIKLSTLYKNGQFSTGKDDNKPFKNIVRPILNLQYRSEGFDVKDVELFVNDAKDYYKSFLIKKFHEKWARANSLDTFIDELVECYVDYGGCLVKNVNQVRPEVVPLQSIVFCDQTDILSGPIGIKHFYSPEQLKEMEKIGWGSESNGAMATIDEVITLAEDSKVIDRSEGKKVKTPGKYIEVYEVHGCLPKHFLQDTEYSESKQYENQMQIVCFYDKGDGSGKNGITLFKGKEKKSIFKLILRDKIYGRALGFGGAEELFEPQVWVNYDIIRIKDMLDMAAKVLYQTTDESFANRNKTVDLENGEIMVVADNKQISQVNTTPVNISLFERSVAEWEAHAQQIGSANDALMGKSPNAGTPFKLQELVTNEGKSIHDYRRGKIATFVDEIYRDWVIPYIVKEINKGQEFLSELDYDEMQSISDSVVRSEANKMIVEKILNGEDVVPDEIEMHKQMVRDQFKQGGNKKFIEIFKDEMKDSNIDVFTNIAGKQKDLAGKVDKLTNIFRTVISAPQVLQQPGMAKLFNQIIESSGLSPIDFSGITNAQPQQPQLTNQPAPQEKMAITQ